jgi:hypothetical protein
MLKGHYLPVFSGERKNLEKEADMTPQELSSEKDGISAINIYGCLGLYWNLTGRESILFLVENLEVAPRLTPPA